MLKGREEEKILGFWRTVAEARRINNVKKNKSFFCQGIVFP